MAETYLLTLSPVNPGEVDPGRFEHVRLIVRERPQLRPAATVIVSTGDLAEKLSAVVPNAEAIVIVAELRLRHIVTLEGRVSREQLLALGFTARALNKE